MKSLCTNWARPDGIFLLTLLTLIIIRCLPTRRPLFLLSTAFSLLIHHKLLFYPQHSANPIHTLSTSFHVFRICYIFLFWQSYCCCCPLTGQCFLSFLLVHDHHDHHPAHSPTAAMSSLPLPAKSADDPSYVPPVYSTRRKPWMGKHKFYPPRETKQASTLMELASSKYLILYRP